MINRISSILILVCFIGILIGTPVQKDVLAQPVAPNQQVLPATGDCRFGGTFSGWSSNAVISTYDFPSIGMGYYLNWKREKDRSVPGYIRYMPVLNVNDESFPAIISALPALVAANPGAIWIGGNEPEDRGMDHVTPEAYAEHFYQYAQVIRSADPTAKLAFGTIVMPTKLRLMYLEFAWNRLIALAGSQSAASALVDIWAPHGFVLNEQGDVNGEAFWGSGIPEGFYQRIPEWPSLQEVISLDDVYNIEIFKTRMIRFRQWMKDHGEQNKPLWLTEYGQLFPPYPKPGAPYVSLPESVTADFMVKTFDWMFTTTDPNIGLPSDDNRLIQKWFWYSINASLDLQGGALIDPDTLQPTIVGNVYLNYVPPAGSTIIRNPDIYPVQVVPTFVGLDPTNSRMGRYKLTVRARNAILADHYVDIQLTVKKGTEVVATGVNKTARCGGDAIFTVDVANLAVSESHTLCATVQPLTLTDVNSANNTTCVVVPPLNISYLPWLIR